MAITGRFTMRSGDGATRRDARWGHRHQVIELLAYDGSAVGVGEQAIEEPAECLSEALLGVPVAVFVDAGA